MQLTRPAHRHPGAARRLAIGLAVGLACVGIVVTAPAAAAQNISGTVAEAETDRPLEGARVALVDVNGVHRHHTSSRADGHFSILAPHPGPWILAVDLLGFGTIRSEPVEVKGGEWVVLRITLAAEAIPLDPVVVTARRSVGSPDIQRFYDRRDRASRTGIGRFLAREEIERMSPNRPSDMLRTIPGVRVVRGATGRGEGIRMVGGCIPAIYIDGLRINSVRINDSIDDYVTVLDIEGIEVYRGPASQVAHLHDPAGCGLVLVWTRSGVHNPEGTLRWRTILVSLAGIALFFLLVN